MVVSVKKASFVGLVALVACVSVCQAQVTLSTARWPENGWMAGGYGGYHITFKNAGATEARATKWTAYWEVNGKPYGEQWGGDLDLKLPPAKDTVKSENGSLPVDVIEKSKPGKPVMAGEFTVLVDGKEVKLPWRLEVPEAQLPEKTKLIKGKHVGVDLMPSHLKTFRGQRKMTRLLDQVYSAMHELTGYTPNDGKMLEIKESPAHPYWAYVEGSGLPIIMNTMYVDSVLKMIDENKMPFGWLHEMGHYFDIRGKWYFWGAASVEWQANWKLCYAYETIPDRSFKAVFSPNKNLAYWPEHEVVLDARQWVDAYFLFTGDPYLADPARKWDTLSSDELHSFFQRLVRVYGWEPFKRWYRTYDRFEKLGLTEPKTPEGTIQLIAAILCKETDSDLVPVFQRWRMPVTREDIEAMNGKYPIKDIPAAEASGKEARD
jgi:hypothetical protein